MKIKQVWVPYWEWEDWINGMWSKGDDERLNEAIEFTGDHVKYGNAMKEVITAWPRTMLNSLTNPSINKRAFLGHCAVSFKLSIQESITRAAWKHLSDKQRYDADKVAQETIDGWTKEYERSNTKLYIPMGAPVLF
jgi:hypothetical protein